MRNNWRIFELLALAPIFLVVVSVAAEPTEVLDDCSDPSRWKVIVSDGVKMNCGVAKIETAGEHESTLRLDYDFVSGGGYAGVQLPLPLDLPPNFEVAFSIRGDLPRNNLEFKLIGESGEDVWWVIRRGFEFPREWMRLASRRAHFEYAWGPSHDPLQKLRAIEITVSSKEGGKGTVWLDDLTFRPLPELKPYAGTPVAFASSIADDSHAAQRVLDVDAMNEWQSAAGDAKPTLTIDFGEPREFGGALITWDPNAFPKHYEFQVSEDGQSWDTVRKVQSNSGRPQYLSLPYSEARAVRLAMKVDIADDHVGVRAIEMLPVETSRDANTLAREMARRAPRGFYPRGIGGEGTFWTIVGVPVDENEALVSEDGAVEIGRQAFSIEPFVFADDRLLSWADAKISQSLARGFAPVPTVTREHDDLRLAVTASADGEAGSSSLQLLYSVTNTSKSPKSGSLLLAIRPYQVNPPYQVLNTPGGIGKVDQITYDKERQRVEVDGRPVVFSAAPDEFGCGDFDGGDVVAFLADDKLPDRVAVKDSHHAASGAAKFGFRLEPGETRTWAVVMPFSLNEKARGQFDASLPKASAVDFVCDRQQAAVDGWDRATATFELLVPPQASDIVNTIRSTLAYILINQDGTAIHPGSRSYERSWIRDGSLTATALLRMGLGEQARAFVDWYAPYQFESGKVPCVVDRRGPDPYLENDSHGEFIMAVMNVYRFTGDKAFLKRHWERVQKAAAFIESQRAERMTEKYSDANTKETHQEPNKPAVNLHAFYGVMPETGSHEGYMAKPMHSYWDDFFAIKGLKDAAAMGSILDEPEAAARYQTIADDFARTLYESIAAAMKAHGIEYIPGCVELGDFDATSTTIALWPCNELSRLPQPALQQTFDRYWRDFVRRRDDPTFEWKDYTPYELRTIGSFILLDQPERAWEAIDFFMKDRRPPTWNQWPEVVHRVPRTARFIGDLPHTWCGSDFVNSVRMMFLYERESDDAIVLLAGVPASWISDKPVGFRELPTYGGRLSCTVERGEKDDEQESLAAQVSGTCPLPKGGLRVSIPLGTPENATVNGAAAKIDEAGRVVVTELPAEINITLPRKTAR